MSVAAAEQRLAEVTAHIAEIGRQIEDKNKKRRRPFATDPHGEWRKVAMKARDELERESRELRSFIERERARLARPERSRKAAEELVRQDSDRATRDARRRASASGDRALWDVYLKAEVALLAIAATGMDVGPLGDSLLRTSQQCVPEWYREHWLRTVYGTTWGREAERAREGRRMDRGVGQIDFDVLEKEIEQGKAPDLYQTAKKLLAMARRGVAAEALLDTSESLRQDSALRHAQAITRMTLLREKVAAAQDQAHDVYCVKEEKDDASIETVESYTRMNAMGEVLKWIDDA
jgi:hypothetical protein